VRPSPHETTNAHGAPVVAVVDDEECVRRSIERLLRSVGYAVSAFAEGAAFVASLESGRPACVVLDLEMPPGMGGLEVLSHLARRPKRVPAIILTGRGTDLSRERATAGGAAAYFTKPFDAALLLAAVDAAIKNGAPTARPASADGA
jgi:FixJ family two-component response regulator